MSNNINTAGQPGSFFSHLSGLVSDMRIREAFDFLEKRMNFIKSFAEKPSLEKMRETYGLMLRFLTTGAPDPSRAGMTNAIRRDILAMGDRLDFESLVADSPGSYYSTARVMAHRSKPLSAIIAEFDKINLLYSVASEADSFDPDISRQYEEALQELFRYIMSTPPGKLLEEDCRMLTERSTDPASPFALSSQIISGLLIGLLEHYDRNRLLALIDIYSEAQDPRIQAQALVGIALALNYHRERTDYDKELKLKLESLADDLTLYPRLRDVYFSILQIQDTKRVITYFEKNVLPQLQKMKPEELKSMMEGSLSPDALDNPEWAERMEKSGLGKKLKKLNDMQLDGADLMVMPFSNLKMFPFFGSPGNWLLPFDSNHTAVRAVIDDKLRPITEFLEMADMMCDSDKYSFVLAINTIPSDRRDMMVASLQANFDTIREQMKLSNQADTLFKREATRYLRNLYRLFTLSSKLFGTKRNSASDPVAMLEQTYDPLALPILGEMLNQKDVIEVAAEFHFKRKNYKEAAPLLRELENFEGVDLPDVWEKSGYILEKQNDPTGALEYYLKAELLNPDNMWLIQHTADMLVAERRFKEAEERLERHVSSGNSEADARLALIKMRSGNHREALQLMRKIYYEVTEGSAPGFGPGLQPAKGVNLSDPDLASVWLTVAEIENGKYADAATHLPATLPEPYLPLTMLLSFLQGDYAVAADHIKMLFGRNSERSAGLQIKAADMLSFFDGNREATLDPEKYLRNWARRHITAAGASYDDFLLLLDLE